MVGVGTFLTTFSQPGLHVGCFALEVVVYDVEVLERRELAVLRKWTLDEELDLAAARPQAIAGVDAQLLAHALDHSANFRVEVLTIVDYVEVRMTDPGGRGVVVELAGELDALRTACVILRRVELLGPVRCGHHVNYLVVAVVAELHVVPAVRGHHQIPLFLRYNC